MCHPISAVPASSSGKRDCPAKRLDGHQRQHLAVQGLAGTLSISQLASEQRVSRKFVYQQIDKAQQALDDAFVSDNQATEDAVLFYLPVTRAWLGQLVVALVLLCHSSLRGVVELLRDLFAVHLSLGSVHNILSDAAAQARAFNARQDLWYVTIGAHDEIFQGPWTVLVGVDVASTYCYLLSAESHLDAETWAIHLWDLQTQSFAPDATIADGGRCLRAGQALAMPQTPCRGDVFHPLRDLTEVVRYLDNAAYKACQACEHWQQEQKRAQKRHGRSDLSVAAHLRAARVKQEQAIALADTVTVLARWLRQDVLALAGPDHAERSLLYDFILAELRDRQALCPRLKRVCAVLHSQRDDLLAFAAELDGTLEALAAEFQVHPTTVRELFNVQQMHERSNRRWWAEARLQQKLGSRFYPLREAVQERAKQVVRASSVVENLNSRLRSYFFLRRHLGPDYLELLRFFLNHRRFLRSEHAERAGKSPAELMTGAHHAHWLELLGYHLFCRN